jgi:hypothetical protein
MNRNIDLSGLEKLESELDKLERNLEKIDGTHQVTGEELLPDSFIRKNTKFETHKAFFDASGIKSQEEIGTPAFDDFIRANTRFESWSEMFKAAGAEWTKRQLESE